MKIGYYEKNYKYGFKIGAYEARCKININLFKRIFNEEYKTERKRIKWLCNYEQEVLLDEFYDFFKHEKEINNEKSKKELMKCKARILKLLR